MTTMRVVGECFFWYRLTRVFPDKFHRAVKWLCVCVWLKNGRWDRFWKSSSFWNFKSHVTLTLTSDDLESNIFVNVSLTLTNTTIWFVAALCFIVDARTYGVCPSVCPYIHTSVVQMYGCMDIRTDIFTGFIRSSLKRWSKKLIACIAVIICWNNTTGGVAVPSQCWLSGVLFEYSILVDFRQIWWLALAWVYHQLRNQSQI